ncbi:uncharacterized protein TM35_000033140 [Trypanosoma theileri]|uniref:Uncharacterized protein n=1 Tax=Trypanosoma theileri TaxID=67003 RepID=A0A1X0P6V7_9TRYP|nr:uncharacterized protein TM35_000033140 [Trypanosoma theileri]ORC92561.1 hypothetical protein TM35_000033140 [Trypanosoma theileri]
MTSHLPTAQKQQQQQKQPYVRLSCTYQGYQGTLEADKHGCKFNHDLVKADFPWDSVKSIRIMTKHVKDVPTSVLVLKTARQKQFSSMFLSNTKHYFYGFDDIVEAVRELMELKNSVDGLDVAPLGDPNSPPVNKPTAPLTGENSNSIYTRQNPSPSGNANNNRAVDSLTAAGRNRATNGVGSLVATPKDDDNLSSASAPQLRNGANGRYDPDEETEGRGGGVNMPLIINRQRHAEPRESICVPPQPPRVGSCSGTLKKRGGRQDISNDYRYVRWGHNLSEALSYYPRGLAGILLGILIVVVLLLLYLLLMPYFLAIGNKLGLRENSPQEKVNHVVQGLEQLHQWQRKHQIELVEGHPHNKKDNEVTHMIEPPLKPPVRITLNDMTAAVKELLGRYISVQREMDALRLRRVRRELGGGDTNFEARRRHLKGISIHDSTDENSDDGQKIHDSGIDWLNEIEEPSRSRRLSLESVAASLRRWRRFFHTVIATIKWAFWGKRSSSGSSCLTSRNQPLTQVNCKNYFWCNSEGFNEKQTLTRYSEVLLDGQAVVEDVVKEDAEERRKCLFLSRELVRLAELIEEMFLEYQEIIMAPQYEAFLRQVPFTSSSSSSSTSTTTTTSSDNIAGNMFVGVGSEDDGMLTGQSSYLLRTILLRRQTLALLELQPLLLWNGFQSENGFGQEKNRSTLSRNSFPNNNSRKKNGNDETLKEEPTREDVEAILHDFVESSTSRNIGDSWTILRNILEEVRYWYDHEKDWQTLILWKLNTTKESDASKNVSKTSKGSNDDFDHIITKVPMFRGLWCFLEEPLQPRHVNKKEEDSAFTSSSSNDDISSGNTKSEVSKGKGIIRMRRCGAVNCCNVEEGIITPSDPYNIFQKGLEMCSVFQKKEQEYLSSNNLRTTVENDAKSDAFSIDVNIEKEKLEEEYEDDVESGYDVANTHVRKFELMTLDVQLRWVNAFELFLLSHDNKQSTWNCNERDGRRVQLVELATDSDEETADMKEMSQIRRRLLSVLGRAQNHYGHHLMSDGTLTSSSSAALIDFVRESAERRKSSWWRFIPFLSWFSRDRTAEPLQCLLGRMQPADPTVRRIYRDLLRVPLGETEDIPWMLLHLLSIPPDMLREYHNAGSSFIFASCFLFLFLLASVVGFMFL